MRNMIHVLVPVAAVLTASWAHAEELTVTTSSVSCGWANRGGLAAAAALEPEGPGYLIPEPWRKRGLRYGTKELVGMIRRAAAAVEREHPGSWLGVADLSRERGGSARNHGSHQSGRDVDLLYYSLDSAGTPVKPGGSMPAFGTPDRQATRCYYPVKQEIPPRHFDVVRNWALVKAMLTDPETRVWVIFLSLGIRSWLLEHAAKIGEPRALIRLVAGTLMRPPTRRAHTDHMHVRIRCTRNDRRRGRCKNDPDLRGRGFGRLRCPQRGAQKAR